MKAKKAMTPERIEAMKRPLAGPTGPGRQRTQCSPSVRPAKRSNVALECGWGKVIMAHTFETPEELARAVQAERPGSRNIAIYVRDPHVVLAHAPQRLFLDPSHTFRLHLRRLGEPAHTGSGWRIRPFGRRGDALAVNRVFRSRRMVPADPGFLWRYRESPNLRYLLAEDEHSGAVLGVVAGIDHVHAFADPEGGSSLWSLAVDPGAPHPGIGRALVCALAAQFRALGRRFMDLSVMHTNAEAIALYEQLGFERVPVFSIKCKNAINEPLFTGPDRPEEALNVYAGVIVDEARRRGVRVEVLDREAGYFRLTLGGRSITCRESLSQLTTAIAMSRCQDKQVTRRTLTAAGLATPEQRRADDSAEDLAFLRRHRAVVVKPANGEQGHGISVDVRDEESLRAAIAQARRVDGDVLIERYCAGEDLRIVVIGYEVVAAALRKPPVIIGDGEHSVRELIEKLSRRRAAATHGESRIPLDGETERCVRLAGHALDDVLAQGEPLAVRKTANLHTGGTLHDVTDRLHPELRRVAVEAARALEIPVTGLDLLVAAPDRPDYVIVEANERPGLANHEPQPTVERFLDFLFPFSASPDKAPAP